ncbi:transporter substrate-binding domain-containing protein [Rheinheimera texasensis]|uniref:transporter substrate-binding domain-containing protein n=1 Tax=Rheinheimera texasensis TaxID=306205 RepID=UPI0004E0F028|nr:transporter substrate-binding domain-containing protein [Rheinheimera texasensis]
MSLTRSWLLVLSLFTLPVTVSVLAQPPAPLAIEIHHYDAESADMLNSGGTDQSADIDTVRLLFKAIATPLQVQQMPIARTDRMMEQGLPVCSLNRVKSAERASKYLFSLPVNFYLGYQLYQHAAAEAVPPALLNKQGQIRSLKALLQQYPRQQIVVPKDYSFGDALDKAVAELPARQITAISTSHYYQHFVAMFEAGRADFILLYPTEMQAYLQKNTALKVRQYPLAQAPAYASGHLMCADSALTRAFVKKVDAALKQLYRQQAFVEANSYTLSVADRRKIQQIIRQHQQH